MTLSVICIALCCFIANHNQVSISTAIKNWPRAKGYYFFTFIFCLNLQIGPIILGQIGESNQIAEFSIALIGVNASNLIINAYFGVQRQEAFYKALKESHEVALSVIWDSLRLAAFFAVFLSALMYIIINFFYIYIFDLRKYPDIVILSNIAMASVPIRIIHASLSPLMSSEEYMRIKNYYLGIAHIAGWVTSYLLASKWGAVGIFVGLILTESITAISYLSTAYQGQMRFRGRGW
jgi:O-antigen/teichoic acid export membrane protein